MKVLLINGSPHENGCTYTALSEIAKVLEKEQIDWEMFQIGTKPIRGCIACGGCRGRNPAGCVFTDDICNELVAKMTEADGIIVGSPVYYAGPNGALCALLDRAFYSASGNFKHKPAAAIVSCRRGGASAAFDRLNKYFTINRMPVVSSQYWNAVHGLCAEDVLKDAEGLQIMRTLGHNMAWMLCSLDGKLPEIDTARCSTNFIR